MPTKRMIRPTGSDDLGTRWRRSSAGTAIALALALSSTVAHAQDTTAARATDTTAHAADTTARVTDTTAQATDTVPAPPALGPGGTHTVLKGETLWTLARMYLGDPFLWPEIYRVNTDVIEDPHWIFPGEMLKIPGQQQVLAAAPAPTPATPTPAPLEAPTTPVASTPDTTDVIVEQIVAAGPTVFRQSPHGSPITEVSVGSGIVGREHKPAIRVGEYYSAPFVDRDGGPRDWGHIIASTDVPAIRIAAERTRLQPHELVYVQPPKGRVLADGDELLVYKLGDELEGMGQLVIPTGVLRVVRAGRDGDAPVAELERMFAETQIGQRVVPLDAPVIPEGVTPEPVDLGVRAKVAWIQGEPAIGSVQSYVVLTSSSRQGIRLGDQFTLLRPREKSDDGLHLPEEPIAVAQVVHVTPYGVTAVITDQRHPAIREGTPARVTAKMP